MASVACGTVVAVVAIPGVRATTSVSSATAVVEGVVRSAMVAIPVAVALYACRHRAQARFGKLLLGFSGVWFVALLSSSSSSLVYSVGRLAGWASVLFLACVILAFPGGRLVSRVDRALAAAAAGTVAFLYVPSALLVARYPSPSPFATCSARCPHNALLVTNHEPAFMSGFVAPFRDALVILIMVLVAARLAQRIRGANTLVRLTLVPVLSASIAWVLLIAFAVAARRIAPASVTTHAAVWLVAFAMPAIALAFLLGIARWHVFVTAAVQRANARLQRLPGAREARDVLAEAFEDQALQIGYWLSKPGRWLTAGGQTLQAPADSSGRFLTEIRDGRRRVVAVEHDALLRDEPAFIGTAGSLARIAFEGERLTARTGEMLDELSASRARLLAAADDERRRIARDLHDGAQQRLVALRLELELEAEKAEHDDAAEAATLRQFSAEIEEALEDFRSMTRGIYPAILNDRGIADAVRSAALRSPIPTTVEVDDLADYPQEIATAVYFCCVEALQNVAKHADGATDVRIVLAEKHSVLRFSISDDGPGFRSDRTRLGAGMINMRDRLSVVGGDLAIQSTPGQGTRIAGRIPLTT
ncbi:MAG: hypothetical protein JO120_10790 [Solirubrobacterales bacterium]|nr:hypothetical protein [Solirubrobacterales bacterium]